MDQGQVLSKSIRLWLSDSSRPTSPRKAVGNVKFVGNAGTMHVDWSNLQPDCAVGSPAFQNSAKSNYALLRNPVRATV